VCVYGEANKLPFVFHFFVVVVVIVKNRRMPRIFLGSPLRATQ